MNENEFEVNNGNIFPIKNELRAFIGKSYLHRTKEIIASITAKQAQTIPAMTPVESFLLLLMSGGLSLQS